MNRLSDTWLNVLWVLSFPATAVVLMTEYWLYHAMPTDMLGGIAQWLVLVHMVSTLCSGIMGLGSILSVWYVNRAFMYYFAAVAVWLVWDIGRESAQGRMIPWEKRLSPRIWQRATNLGTT